MVEVSSVILSKPLICVYQIAKLECPLDVPLLRYILTMRAHTRAHAHTYTHTHTHGTRAFAHLGIHKMYCIIDSLWVIMIRVLYRAIFAIIHDVIYT